MRLVERFTDSSMAHGDRRVRAVSMKCGKCGQSESHVRGSSKTFVDEQGEYRRFCNMFERAGWLIGKRPQDDRCPACLKKIGIERVTPQPKPVEKTAMPAVAAAPARVMSGEDGRIIIAKLEEVYDTKETGYQSGWNDQRLAVDLNVPRAWVAKMRTDFFGPEGSNPEIRQLVEDAQAHKDASAQLIVRCNVLLTEAKSHAAKGEMIQRRIDHIQQQVR